MVALTHTPFKLKPELSALKTGVYCIRNKVNGKVYVGSAAHSLSERWKTHRLHLGRKTHPNRYLQAAWNKYGKDAFEFTILAKCSPEWCLCVEQIHLNRLRASNREFGYNLCPTAGSQLGFKWSPEQCEKNREVGRRRPKEHMLKMHAAGQTPEAKAKRLATINTPEHKAKMSAIRKGFRHTPESRAKIGAAHKGRILNENQLASLKAYNAKRTPEDIARNAAKRKQTIEARGFLHDEETRAAISKAKKERMAIPENRKAVSEGLKRFHEKRRRAGIVISFGPMKEETKAKLSAAIKGRKLPQELKDRLKVSQRLRREREAREKQNLST